MADIWDRVNEAIDTDPLQLRAIVTELLARAEHAEEGAQLSSERLGEVRTERDALADEMDDMEGVISDLGVVRLQLQDAIGRVRALADQWVAQADVADDPHGLVPVLATVGRTVLAALDGGE